jgi:hypothetical protein
MLMQVKTGFLGNYEEVSSLISKIDNLSSDSLMQTTLPLKAEIASGYLRTTIVAAPLRVLHS